MTKPRKTPNPFKMDEWHSPSVRGAWNDGYKCGHSDAEMDARDHVVSLTNEFNRNMLHTIDSQAIKISNLVEKNDEQVKIIEHLDQQVNDLRRDNSVRGGSILDAQAKIRELEAELREFTQRSDSYHGELGTSYDNGYNTAIKDIVVFAQSTGATVKFLTDHQYKRLKGVLNTVRTHAVELVDEVDGLDGTTDMFENVLADIESPPRTGEDS